MAVLNQNTIPDRFVLDQYDSGALSGDPRFYVMCFTNQTGLLTVSESVCTVRFEAAKAVDVNVSVIQVENLTVVVKGSLCPGGLNV